MKKFLILLFLMAIGTSVYASTDGYIYNYYNGNYGEFYTDNGVLFVKNCDGSTKDMLVRFPQYKNITSYTVPDKVIDTWKRLEYHPLLSKLVIMHLTVVRLLNPLKYITQIQP